MQIYKICLNWIKFQESEEEQEILNEQMHWYSQNFKNQEIQEMFYQYNKSYYISLFRICTLFQLITNILISVSSFNSNHINAASSRLVFTFWLFITLIIQQRLCQKNWTKYINFFITMDNLLNILVYFRLYQESLHSFTNIQQDSSMTQLEGLLKAFFALSYLLICPSWQCQVLILTTYFVPIMLIQDDFKSYQQIYIYISLLFLCYVFRIKDKYTKLIFMRLYTQKQNIMDCKKIFDECVPSSIIIVKTIDYCQARAMQVQCENQQLIDTNQLIHCKLLYANQFAKQYLNCCVGFNCTEQIEAISVIQDDDSRSSLVDVLKSQIWVDIVSCDGQNFEYALGQNQKILNCFRMIDSSTLIEQTNKQKQYCDVTLRSCIWEGEKSIIIVLNDTTDRVNRIDYFKDLNDYKDKLLATVSHDLKTPLNATQLLLFSMRELCSKNQQLEVFEIQRKQNIYQVELLQYINDIFQSNCMLITMINDLLDYSQMRKGSLRLLSEKFSLDECLKSVFSMFFPQTQQKKLSLIFEKKYFSGSFNLETDQNRLKQILINLLSNSLKFTFEGHIKLIIEFQDPHVQFTVEDTGIGMPQYVLDKLFQPYATFNLGDKNKQGVGLGLVISSKLVGLLGETEIITVNSEEGQGSQFIFKIFRKLNQQQNNLLALDQDSIVYDQDSLVYDQDNDTEVAQQPNMTQKSLKLVDSFEKIPKRQYQVMIADDTIFNIIAFKIVLQKILINCNVTDVYNGREALRQVEQGIEFDLIFMDINMPLMDGHQATELIRKYEKEHQTIASTIIMASASTVEHEYRLIQNSGANGLIEKPIQIKKLKELLKRYKFIN